MRNKKIIISIMSLFFGIAPVFAKMDGRVSKGAFFDAEKTIMTEVLMDRTIKTGKYWEKNIFSSPKYRPLFMLSNKELFDLMPKENVSVSQRIATPSVYNISLKSAEIKSVSLALPNAPAKAAKQEVHVRTQKTDAKSHLKYEQAKNPGVEPEQKLETAVSLKNSGTVANCNLAIDLLNDVTQKEPYNAYAYYLKGELFAQKKDFENAMKNYVQALKINPTSKQCYGGIAKILEPTNKQLAQKYYLLAK